MPANTAPIFSKAPDVQWITKVSTANNTSDITTGTIYQCCSADPLNGSFIEEIRVKADPANNTAATVVRFWINNGSTTATAANSAFIGELGLPATTASAVNAQPDFSFPVNKAIPASYRIYATLGTAPGANAAFTITTFLGKF